MQKNFRRIAAALIISGVALTSLSACTSEYDGKTTNCKVTNTDRTTNSDGESDARVYTANCGTFKVGDDPFHGQYNSADTFGSIQKGHTYNFKAYGYRNGFTSDFPNIVQATEVSGS